MIRVEVLDSSPVFLCGLAQLLPRDGIEIVGMRTVPYEDLAFTADIYLMDACALQLLGGAGVQYVSRVAEVSQVIIITPTREFGIQTYLDAGAVGSISKDESVGALVRAIRDTARPTLQSVFPGIKANPKLDVTSLSGRESQVLQFIACGYTHDQIARRLGISPHTVNTYVKRIRAKLTVGNKAELTRAAVLGNYLQWVPSS
jgi:DNA-binding NarL/FixJ family response regulator